MAFGLCGFFVVLMLVNVEFGRPQNALNTQNVIKVLYTNEESNVMGDKALDAVLKYIEGNSSMEMQIDIEKVYVNSTDGKVALEEVCAVYDRMVNDSTPPHFILDMTLAGEGCEAVKAFTFALGLPTFSSSYGQEGDLRQWRDMSLAQTKYLIQIIPPSDLVPEVIRSLISNQQFDNAAILFDDNYVMDHKYKSLLQNIPCRHLINHIAAPDEMKTHIQHLRSMDLTNFFVLASIANFEKLLSVACELKYFGRRYSWYFVTQDSGMWTSTCNNASVVFVRPQTLEEPYRSRLDLLKKDYGLTMEPEVSSAFYFDFAMFAFVSVRNMLAQGSWPQNLPYLLCDDYDGSNIPPRLGLNIAREISSNDTQPLEWTYGPLNISANGYSHLVFNMTITSYEVVNGTIVNPDQVAVWQSGFEHECILDEGLEDLSNWTAHKFYRVVTKAQPPIVYYNETSGEFYGYCIDLLNDIAKLLNFDYELYEVPDGKWGSMDEDGNWNGVINELIEKRADIAIGSISVMAERENVIDFTAPFYDLVGITILMKKPESTKSLFKFLSVLDSEVWMMILGLYFVTSALIYLFDRFSPYSYQNHPEIYKYSAEKRLFNVKECMWYAMTSLTPQGGGEPPKTWSGRLVSALWWTFAFIIIASYTANLAAFLTVSRLEAPIDNLDDLSKQFKVAYSTVDDSYEQQYFMRMAGIEERFYQIWKDMALNDSLTPLERARLAVWDYPISDKYQKIWKAMNEAGFPKTLEEAIARVKTSKPASDGYALLADATDVRYLQLTDCKLQMIGEEFSKKPYAVAMQQNSPLKDQMNAVVLTLLNKRKLEKLKELWWTKNPKAVRCDRIEDASDGISIENIGGVFIVIFVGIALACATLAFEYFYFKRKKEQKLKELQEELMKYTGDVETLKNIGIDEDKLLPKFGAKGHLKHF